MHGPPSVVSKVARRGPVSDIAPECAVFQRIKADRPQGLALQMAIETAKEQTMNFHMSIPPA